MLNELFSAIETGNIKTINQLLEEGANPNGYLDNDQVTPLHTAAQLNFFAACQVTEVLLSRGADPSNETIEQITPIDIAELYQNEQLISILKTAKSIN